MAEMKLVILPDNTVKIAVPSGVTFEEASRLIKRVSADLGQEVGFVLTGEPEQHRHDREQVVLETSKARF